MTSLRKTVMDYVTLLLLVVGFAAAITSYYVTKREVNSFQDNALQEVALTAGLIFRHDIDPRIDTELEDQLVVQIWDHAAQPVHRSGPPVDIPHQSELGYSNVSAGGERWRVFRARDAQHAIQVSQRWSAREEVAAHAAMGAAAPLVVAIPLAWLLIGWGVGRILVGLGTLSANISRRSVDARDAIGMTGVPAEITPLISAMNTLIGRHHQALETQRRFVADAAHELRTPLAALQIQIDNLRSQELTPGVRETATDLLAGIRRATYSVNQLMTLTRADASMESELETIQSGVLMRMILAPFSPIAEAKGVRLTTGIDDDVALTVRASEVQLVLSNLLDNAVRYTGHGGEVHIRARKLDAAFVIEISDNGCGIPENALPHIYDRFFRAAPPDIEGTGLGLAIARTAADRNGLQMTVSNNLNAPNLNAQGVTATVRIPVVVGS